MLMIACTGFLIGLGFSRTGIKLSVEWLLILLPLTVALFRKRSLISALTVLLTLFVLGTFRGQSFIIRTNKYDQLNQRKVTIIAYVENDAEYNDKKQLSFDVSKIDVKEPIEAQLVGRIKVSGFGENAVFKGDKLVIKGKLYETRGSRQASIGYAELNTISRSDNTIDIVRRNFAAGISNVLPDPQAPFGLGLLIGQRTTLDENTTKILGLVGLTHIIAVSGYNLTIIIRFVHRLFSKRSRYQTVLFSSLIIGLFLMMTGFSASIVRAAIVCGFSLLAWYYGRKFRPLLLLLLTACITAGWYPIYIWSDIGWYLSFLAFFGVLILAPLISNKLFKKEPKAITSVFIETFSAQLMTLPLILYIFHQTSLISLFSNVLTVPFVPFAMIFTLIAGIAGMINAAWLYIFALPAKFLLTYILDISGLLSRIPNTLISQNISAGILMWSYGLICILTLVLWHRLRGKRDIITEKNIFS